MNINPLWKQLEENWALTERARKQFDQIRQMVRESTDKRERRKLAAILRSIRLELADLAGDHQDIVAEVKKLEGK